MIRWIWFSPRHSSALAPGAHPWKITAATEGSVIELPEAVHQPRRLGDATVLVVDDDPAITDALALLLEAEGYRAITALDGLHALQSAHSEHPDLVLLDRMLPNMDGLEVCRRLRADIDPTLNRVPVLMVTARDGSDDTRAGFEAGVNDYITKPFAPAHMLVRVREWLLRSQR